MERQETIAEYPAQSLEMAARNEKTTLMVRLAHAISWVLHPFVLPIYVISVLFTATAFSSYSPELKWYLVWVVTLYTICIPALALGVLKSLGRISDWRIDKRHERLWPLAVGVICYLVCAFTIGRIPSVRFLQKFLIAAACCEAMCFVVTYYWKISLHLTGLGAVVALFLILNILNVGNMMAPLMGAILCAGVLASARLYIGCHNAMQIIVGFCGGLVVATLAMLFL